MSYQSQWALTYDDAFVSRGRAAITNQSAIFKDDQRADIKALAETLLRGTDGAPYVTFQSMLGAAPGFATMADQGDGTVNSTLIADDDILAAVQAEYPTVAALYYAPDGGPIE